MLSGALKFGGSNHGQAHRGVSRHGVSRPSRLRRGRDRRLRADLPARHPACRAGLRADRHGDDLRHRADLGLPLNPAVTIGLVAAGRLEMGEAWRYMVAQLLGGIAGAALLYLLLSGKLAYDLAK